MVALDHLRHRIPIRFTQYPHNLFLALHGNAPTQGRCQDCQIKLKHFYSLKQPAHLSAITHVHEQLDHSSMQSGIDAPAKSPRRESSTVEH